MFLSALTENRNIEAFFLIWRLMLMAWVEVLLLPLIDPFLLMLPLINGMFWLLTVYGLPIGVRPRECATLG